MVDSLFKLFIKRCALFLLILVLPLKSFCQSITGPRHSFDIGIIDTVQSKILGQNRVINVYLPIGYTGNDSAKYPVIYLLDGSADEDFIHVVGLVQFLTMINAMPNSVVVGIANTDRKHDFTHSATVPGDLKLVPTSGGSQKFIDFLGRELQLYVQQHYKVLAGGTLVGQSLGGLLATEVLLKKPALFNSYIIVSPSLWWNDESLLKSAETLLLQAKFNINTKVCIAVGNEGKQMEDDAAKLADALNKNKGSGATVISIPMPAENHLTILHNALYKAFLSLYAKK